MLTPHGSTLSASILALIPLLLGSAPLAIAATTDDDAISLTGLGPEGEPAQLIVDATDVAVEVSASYASVTLTQRFTNPHDFPLEAVYRYPLPHDASVTRVGMIIGDTLINSELRPKEEARARYEAAKEEGHHAALTESLKPNIFEQAVANIMPGDVVYITLHFVAPMHFSEGVYRFNMPTVVGPRFDPRRAPESATSRTRSAVNPRYIRAPQATHALSLSMRLRPGKPVFQVFSDSHALEVQHTKPDDVWVHLKDPDALANRAVNIQYRLATAEASSGLIAHRDNPKLPGTFALTLDPPAHTETLPAVPRELIFVVDTSGSMMGTPMTRVRAAMKHAVQSLGPDDIFNIIDFASEAAKMSEGPLTNTPENVERALSFITEMRSAGGTDMLAGIRAALDGAADPNRMRVVCFMTDGYIGNEEDVLEAVRQHIGQSRLFSFGVGADINTFLLSEMSRIGRGATQTVNIGAHAEPIDQVVGRFYAMIGQPVLTDIVIDWGNLKVSGAARETLPDLFAGQPLKLLGRYHRAGSDVVRLSARRGSEPITLEMAVTLPEREPDHAALEVMWAKAEITSLLRTNAWEDTPEVVTAVTELAMKYSLLSRYTSFIAVQRDIVANDQPEHLNRVLAAVHLPAGTEDQALFGQARPVSLSPNAIKPGDPEILVNAPEDARAVTALLPWGEHVYCSWDAGLRRWIGRFLVPREADDGAYRVRIFIEDAVGDIIIHSVGYTVDSEAPLMRLELEDNVAQPGGRIKLTAYPVTQGHKAEDGAAYFRAELRRAVAHLGEHRVILRPSDDGASWTGELSLDETIALGHHRVRLVVTDRANNTSTTDVILEVQ